MTQYATTEEKYECLHCEISCTKREMVYGYGYVESNVEEEVVHCPNCKNHSTFLVFTEQRWQTI